MNIIFFAHPESLGSQSMPRFVSMLANGMQQRGHHVELRKPKAHFSRLPGSTLLKKWFSYLDQYIIFPSEERYKIKKDAKETLYVFSDQALGPWVPLVSSRPHAIHCHDFLAQNSAHGKIIENRTGWTGKLYQSYIRKGYLSGKNFISVSENTQKDLHEYLSSVPSISKVIYNGLNPSFITGDISYARDIVGRMIQTNLDSGYLLHVGGNQWYKNRVGVIEIYSGWRQKAKRNLPLIMIGPAPNNSLMKTYSNSQYKSEIHLLTGIEDEFVKQAYIGASAFLFPSLAEGFGWPIAEAMACGCPVITTNEAPMTEVAGGAAFLIARKPHDPDETKRWVKESSKVIDKVISLNTIQRNKAIQKGLENIKRFNVIKALDNIEAIYQQILQESKPQ